jgi:hypothetical protein
MKGGGAGRGRRQPARPAPELPVDGGVDGIMGEEA